MSCITSADSVKSGLDDLTINTYKSSSTNGRKIIKLPTAKNYQSDWDKLGIVWLEPAKRTISLAKALLPDGWQTIKGLTKKNVTLLIDENQIPRVHILKLKKFCQSEFEVFFLTKEEGKTLMEKEKSFATICKHRFKKPSKKHPYGVFFVKSRISDNSMHYFNHVHRSCHGFFPNEEIAKQAENFLEEYKGFFDALFVEKIDNSNKAVLKEQGYIIVNGFIDRSWYKSKKMNYTRTTSSIFD